MYSHKKHRNITVSHAQTLFIFKIFRNKSWEWKASHIPCKRASSFGSCASMICLALLRSKNGNKISLRRGSRCLWNMTFNSDWSTLPHFNYLSERLWHLVNDLTSMILTGSVICTDIQQLTVPYPQWTCWEQLRCYVTKLKQVLLVMCQLCHRQLWQY